MMFIFLLYFDLMQDWEQILTRAELHLQRYTKWFQKSNTIDFTCKVMQQATLVVYRSAEVHKYVMSVNYKSTIFPSQFLQRKCNNYFSKLVSYLSLSWKIRLSKFWKDPLITTLTEKVVAFSYLFCSDIIFRKTSTRVYLHLQRSTK